MFDFTRAHARKVCRDGVSTMVCMSGLIMLCSVLGLFDEELSMAWALGSFGASMTLILACPGSPLGSARHAVIGNTVSALIGCVCHALWPDCTWWAALCAVTLAITFMSASHTLHPPGGASALLAIFGGESIQALGWLYPLCPVLLGTLWILWVRKVFHAPNSSRLAWWRTSPVRWRRRGTARRMP